MKEFQKSKTTIEKAIEIDSNDIRKMLSTTFPELFKDITAIRVFVRVPGGGDWSNTDLSIGYDAPLVVHIKTEIES